MKIGILICCLLLSGCLEEGKMPEYRTVYAKFQFSAVFMSPTKWRTLARCPVSLDNNTTYTHYEFAQTELRLYCGTREKTKEALLDPNAQGKDGEFYLLFVFDGERVSQPKKEKLDDIQLKYTFKQGELTVFGKGSRFLEVTCNVIGIKGFDRKKDLE